MPLLIYEILYFNPEMSRRSRPLSCSYRMGGGDTRLTYAPVKVEEEWDEPSIIRYHDILSESLGQFPCFIEATVSMYNRCITGVWFLWCLRFLFFLFQGSAVLWYNLLQNGELSELSLHASCPVLQGSKWVAVKWVHERGQEFRRPCSLSKTE
uniref:Prolyl 4-hydroxylase alpha subunit domain-containing protein n=1 Tax=Electrophorus electricus TaxID=8005 RepID=A0A4W4G4D4_ELEEL